MQSVVIHLCYSQSFNEIVFMFQKSLVQERFKSNMECRYQIIVSEIKFRKGFAMFMILIALFKKCLS